MTATTTPITKQKIYFTVFVVAWTILCTVASQYIVGLPMAILLGESVVEPVWTLVYYLLSYIIAIALIIKLPPQLVKIYHKNRSKRHQTSATVSDKKTSVSANNPPKTDHRNTEDVTARDFATTTADLGIQNLPTFVDIGLAPIGYVVYIFLARIATSFMRQFDWFEVNQAQDIGFGYYLAGIDRIFAILAIVFVAPIAEELIMRGWLYGKLRRKWNLSVAILIVSLCFAVLHGQWNVGVSVFFLSLILCGLREVTGTIWSGMLLHILVNGIAFYALYIAV